MESDAVCRICRSQAVTDIQNSLNTSPRWTALLGRASWQNSLHGMHFDQAADPRPVGFR